jgi:FkbM family methyltransferase
MGSFLTGIYSLARSSGFLDTRAGSELFIAAYFQYKKRLDDPFDGLIRKRPELFRGGHILDVGANIGYCSTLFAHAADAGRLVFAFEPEPFNMALLERVIRKRGLECVVPVQTAVGAAEGKIPLKLNPRHHGDHRVVTEAQESGAGCIEVPLTSIDRFLEQRNAATPVRFIKIDVQGYELPVCQGAERTLALNPECSVVLEYMPEALESLGFRPSDLPQWFAARGYDGQILRKDGSLQPGVPTDVGARGYVDLLFSRR